MIMSKTFSPATIISFVGALLTVIGLVSYFSNAANLSVPTFFYGVPIMLIGLALKNSELPPTVCTNIEDDLIQLKAKIPKELQDLINDVTRWKYGQRAHLESSLQVLKLWDEIKPPQLKEINLLKSGSSYGVQMKFESNGVPLDKWDEKKDRLSRFFAKNLQAELVCDQSTGKVELTLLTNKEFN